MNCANCEEQRKEIVELKRLNAELSSALGIQVSRRSNTDMIMGAALSGGDALALAKSLAENEAKNEAKKETSHAAR